LLLGLKDQGFVGVSERDGWYATPQGKLRAAIDAEAHAADATAPRTYRLAGLRELAELLAGTGWELQVDHFPVLVYVRGSLRVLTFVDTASGLVEVEAVRHGVLDRLRGRLTGSGAIAGTGEVLWQHRFAAEHAGEWPQWINTALRALTPEATTTQTTGPARVDTPSPRVDAASPSPTGEARGRFLTELRAALSASDGSSNDIELHALWEAVWAACAALGVDEAGEEVRGA
jgi:hypothetical protein